MAEGLSGRNEITQYLELDANEAKSKPASLGYGKTISREKFTRRGDRDVMGGRVA